MSAAAGTLDSPGPAPPPMSESRRRLLEAATTLFYHRGARATSVREITHACGLTQGALYNHFSSKEELLYTLVREIHTTLNAYVTAAQADAGDDAQARLVAVVQVYVSRNTQYRERARVANREYRLLTGDWLADVLAIRRRLRDQVVAVLQAGQQAGAFHLPGGADPHAATITATAILDMCVHISEWFSEDGPHTIAELQQRYATLALRMAGYDPGHLLPRPVEAGGTAV